MNLPESLAGEIARVSALRSQYAALDGMPNVNVKPALAMMDAALQAAKKAVGTGDIAEQISALQGLSGFTE